MPRWFYSLAADLVVISHLAYMAYVVLGEVLIVAGIILRWQWVRNPWFRWTHLAAILLVVVETAIGMTCPLTDWEYELRELAGQVVKDRDASFTGRVVRQVLFVCDAASQDTLNVAYFAFGTLVLTTLFLAPPRRRKVAPPASRQDQPVVIKQETRPKNLAQSGAGPPSH